MPWSFDIEVEAAPASEAALWSIDFPRPGTRLYGDRLEIRGWAMGRRAPAVAVEAVAAGHGAASAVPNLPREDVAAAFRDVPHALNSGLYLPSSVPKLERAELSVSIVLPDGERVDAAVFHLAGRWSERWSKAEAPLVSIVIPCYNQAHFLRDAIDSVRRQTYPNVEIVVVDDGSTDDTSAVAAELGVRCIRQENRGLAAARNRGLAESSGEYLVFLDADDRLLPHGIEANMDAFETRPEAAFVSGWFRPTTPTGDPIPWEIPPPAPPEGDPYVALLEASYWTVPGAALFRRGPLTALGAFNAAFRGAEDWDLEMRMARKYPVYAHGSGPISEYRQHPASMSRDAALMVESCLGALKAQRQDAGGDESLTAAYRGGVARVQGYFGEALATDLAIAIRRRSWGRAIRAAWVLARRYPGGLLSTWGKLGAPLE